MVPWAYSRASFGSFTFNRSGTRRFISSIFGVSEEFLPGHRTYLVTSLTPPPPGSPRRSGDWLAKTRNVIPRLHRARPGGAAIGWLKRETSFPASTGLAPAERRLAG